MKKINIDLDILDQQILENLIKRTGKSEAELLKLALFVLNEKLAAPTLPAPVYIPYPYYVPAEPVNPNPIQPYWPYTAPNTLPRTPYFYPTTTPIDPFNPVTVISKDSTFVNGGVGNES